MAITPQNLGAIDTPNTLTPDSAGSVAVPNTLTPESAGIVAVPNTLASGGINPNIFLYSQDFSDSVWSKFGINGGAAPVVQANQATAPDGTLTADKVTFVSGGGSGRSVMRQAVTLGQDGYQSYWVKSAGAGSSIGITTGGVTKVVSIGAEWSRVSDGIISSSAYAGLEVSSITSSTAEIYVWGAQLEESLAVTAYAKTQDESRVAGSVSIPNSLAAESAGSVAVPNTLNAETAGSVAVPNTLTTSDAKALPRALTPTVDINYSAGLFAQNGSAVAESDLITFARASTGTFINRQLGATGRYEYFLDTAASGVQRIEYDAATGENLGALIEQASTNLCLRSEEFDNAAWTKSSSAITANDAQAPDLTTTADKLEAPLGGSSNPIVSQGSSVSASSSYTVSAFVKRAEASFIQIFLNTGHVSGDPRINFDLSSGTIGSQDADIDAASITPAGNDWYRVSATVETAGTVLRPYFMLIKSATDTRYQANSWTAGEGLYIWGAQIEQAAIPTSYIPTTTAAVSRLADQVSIPVAGNVPSGDVTFYAKVETGEDESTGANRFVYRVAANAQAILGLVGPTGNLVVRHGSTAPIVKASGSKGESYSLVHTFDSTENTLSGYFNGVQSFSQDAGARAEIGNAGVIGIGNNSPIALEQLNGHIKRFTIYDEALTADEVAQL